MPWPSKDETSCHIQVVLDEGVKNPKDEVWKTTQLTITLLSPPSSTSSTTSICQVFQRAAGFFAGHNDNYNVSWADAARFLSSNVETHQLTHTGWIIVVLFRMINDEKEDPSKPPLPGCNVQFVRWRTRWVLDLFQGLWDGWTFV